MPQQLVGGESIHGKIEGRDMNQGSFILEPFFWLGGSSLMQKQNNIIFFEGFLSCKLGMCIAWDGVKE